ncbi:MAG: MoaD/ThiS/QbsE family sulfur carrier protein [uncultured Caballeronia sp.]|nr:MAG: MoaD/ThiS/QbsE family sulfur carrier protein [uncultured Caballeronia sp.]
MAHIFFAASIQRHIATPEREIDARTLSEALEAIFAAQPRLRGYILDDQGALRRHLAVFVDGGAGGCATGNIFPMRSAAKPGVRLAGVVGRVSRSSVHERSMGSE